MPRVMNLDKKIEKAKESVNKAKEKYDAALKELKELEEKRDLKNNEKLVEAIKNSDKSVDEVLAFLGVQEEKTEE